MHRLTIFILAFFCTCGSLWAQVDFRKETIYFLLPTRFYDGDSTNNRPTEWCSYIPGVNNPNITNPKDVTWRGDFKGLIERMNYVKDMGFTAIWMTPVVQNRGPLDYHGYHAWDFTKVDPRYESPGATFKDVIEAAHAKGIKIILDIVTNHSGRYGIKSLAELKYNTDPTQDWGKKSNGTPLTDNPGWSYDGLTPNPDDNKIWSRANLAKMPAPYNQNLAAYNWPSTESFVNTSDPNWFHQSGNGFVQGWDDTTNCYQRAIAGDCPDLNTGSQTVRDYFFNAYKQYIDMGVDGFRWDTWKHMNKQDIFALSDRFKAYKPDLFIFGEVAQKRHELHPVQELNPHWYTWKGGVGSSANAGVSVIDFYAEATFHNIFQDGGGFSGVTAASRYDHLYADPSTLVTWLDNHDFGPNNDWNMRYSGSDENLAACMNFMFTWRGIPTVYYGTESRFMSGAYTDLHDAAGISRSLNETGRAYYGDAMASAPNHKIYKHLRKLNAIRKAVPALQNGSWTWAGNAPGNGVGYTRQSGSSFVCVGLAKDGSAFFNFNSIPNGTYRDAVTGREIVVGNGNLSFNVTSGSAGIYVKDGPGMIGESGAGFFEPCVNGCVSPLKVSISPVGTNYSAPVTVSMSATGGTAGYTIRYTLDGSMPTSTSAIYTAPFSVSALTTVRALAFDNAGRVSDVAGERYTFAVSQPVVSITPASGNYTSNQSVAMSVSGGKSPYTIFYTTNGSTPTTASTVYSAPITVSTATTVKAIARDANNQLSTVVQRDYTFVIPPPVVSATPASGNFPSGSVSVSLSASSARPPVTIFYTTDGSTPTTASATYSSALNLSGPAAKTLKYFGRDAINQVSAVQTQTYTFTPIQDFTVYFKRPTTWGTGIRIHYWNSLPTGALTATTWPGAAMTQVCGDWYKFTFSGVTSTNLIFNDGAGKQTVDLSASATSWYDGAWLASAPNMVSAPVANFTSSVTSGLAPLAVSFNASSSTSCTALTYNWNFGNGQTGTGVNASTSYATAGTYTVTLTVTDASNQTATRTQTITVTNPQPAITVYFKKPAAWGTAVKIYYWNPVPTGAYAAVTWPGVAMTAVCNGWYSFTFPSGLTSTSLIFNDGTSQTADLSTTATRYYDGAWLTTTPVINAPKAIFTTSTTSGSTPLTVSFNGSGSTVCNGPLTYLWKFGNGATATTATASATYSTAGTFTARLIVTDAQGRKDSSSTTITITSSPRVKLHFKRPATWLNTPRLYYWATSPALPTVSWPGLVMTNEGNGGWWGYTITGALTSNVIFNNSNAPQTADLTGVTGEVWYDNGWVAKPAGWVRQAVAGNDEDQALSWSVYPNPVRNELNISLTGADGNAHQVVLYSTSGKEVARWELAPDVETQTLPRPEALASGLYLLRVSDAGGAPIGKSQLLKLE